MIVLDTENGRFNYRVAGVCVHDGHVLLHRAEHEDFWSMPGGRPELLETSRTALEREMREEIGQAVATGRLLWLVENFYEYEGRQHHELAFYYDMTLPAYSPHLDVRQGFTGTEEGIRLLFRWFPIDRVEQLRLYPSFLRTGLKNPPAATEHLVHVDSSDAPSATLPS